MNKTYKWEGSGTKLPDGHTIIETHDGPDGVAWAIFDDSGSSPETSDDGILWLDPTRCLNASTDTIPLQREANGERLGALTDTATILYLSKMFRWTIEDRVRGHFYIAA